MTCLSAAASAIRYYHDDWDDLEAPSNNVKFTVPINVTPTILRMGIWLSDTSRMADIVDVRLFPFDVLFEVSSQFFISHSIRKRGMVLFFLRSFQVLGWVNPLDLLRLSRVSKEFRKVLLHPSSSPAWRNSFASIEGLPPCPKDLSLPAWANLAFGQHCMVMHFSLLYLSSNNDGQNIHSELYGSPC